MNYVKTIVLAALLTPISIYAAQVESNQTLAKRCHQLSKELSSLSTIETVPFCVDKITDGSIYTEMAGEDLIINEVNMAKLNLSLAIQALAYSSVEDCAQAININITKNELQTIKDSLQ